VGISVVFSAYPHATDSATGIVEKVVRALEKGQKENKSK
jgi:hypothetical protein